MSEDVLSFLAVVIAYLFGSIPFGVILTKIFGAGDLRSIGSGNIGATNVLRTGRKGLAAGTLILDGGKGAVAVLIAGLWGQDVALAAGSGAILGHLFPVWLNFKGGKGVATFLGALFGLHWPTGLIFCAVWLGAAAIWRYSSLSALIASLVAPVALFVSEQGGAALVVGVMAVILWRKHRENIARLIAGEESRIGQKG